jgi:hypothetical protein
MKKMIVIIGTQAKEYTDAAFLVMLKDEDFVRDILAGKIQVLGTLTFAQTEQLFETESFV